MNDLMSIHRVNSFEPILAAYAKANGGLNPFDAIDGGAGSGSTARAMRKYLSPSRKVFAFEPFPGNHGFFEEGEQQIVLFKKALAERARQMTFRVPSVVPKDSEWGRQGFEGYSSVGHLVTGPRMLAGDLEVECVPADRELPTDRQVGFIKLDLQGGELNALCGMTEILRDTQVMWVEFSNQPGVLEFLAKAGFMVFDTEYFMMGQLDEDARKVFDITKTDVALSTGARAWFGYRKHSWMNYDQMFKLAQQRWNLVQTDLVCVNQRFLPEFVQALQHLIPPQRAPLRLAV